MPREHGLSESTGGKGSGSMAAPLFNLSEEREPAEPEAGEDW